MDTSQRPSTSTNSGEDQSCPHNAHKKTSNSMKRSRSIDTLGTNNLCFMVGDHSCVHMNLASASGFSNNQVGPCSRGSNIDENAQPQETKTTEQLLQQMEEKNRLTKEVLGFLQMVLLSVGNEQLIEEVNNYVRKYRKDEDLIITDGICLVKFRVTYSSIQNIKALKTKLAQQLGISMHRIFLTRAGEDRAMLTVQVPKQEVRKLKAAIRAKMDWLRENEVIGVHIDGESYLLKPEKNEGRIFGETLSSFNLEEFFSCLVCAGNVMSLAPLLLKDVPGSRESFSVPNRQQAHIDCTTTTANEEKVNFAIACYMRAKGWKTARYIMDNFNRKFGTFWHCIVGNGFSHCTESDYGCRIKFTIGKEVVYLFRHTTKTKPNPSRRLYPHISPADRIRIHTSRMDTEMEYHVIDCCKRACGWHTDNTQRAKFIKEEFDKEHNDGWNCILGGNFASYVHRTCDCFIDMIMLGKDSLRILLFRC